MKRIFTLITVFTLLGTLSANGVVPVDTSEVSRSSDASFGPPTAPQGGKTKSSSDVSALEAERSTAEIPLLLYPGMDVNVDGSRLRIQQMTDTWTGTGTLYFPALDEYLAVEFNQLEVNAFGDLLDGTIRARTRVPGEGQGAMPTTGTTLPLNITPHLRSRQNFVLPEGALMALTDVRVTDQGTFVGLDFATPTLVEDDMLSFTGQRLKVDALTFCLEDTALDIVSGGGFIDDFEFPMRILAGDPDEEDAGSYVTFDCDGFKEFNLSAQYPFPKAQVVPAANSRDTVFANFRIKATGLGDFVAFATVTPFEIVGVDDMVYTIDSAYVDYSDTENPVGFDWDPVTEAEPEMGWKGLFLRRLQVTLPESVGAFNGGEEILIGGQNIVYSRGNGMSGELYAYNLLDLSEGALDGWGFSIDTVETTILQNSIGDFHFNGDVFIPVFGEGDKIAYNAFLGDESLTLALEVAGTYTVPFLGDVEMTLTEDSKAGVRFGSSGPEPYLDASGQIDIQLGGEMLGVTIPEVNLPGIKFQHFKLNDLELAATQAANVATAGMDRMSFGTFDWSGINLGAAASAIGDAMDAAEAAQNPLGQTEEKKVNGKPVSIEDINFETIEEGGQELKRLQVKMLLNLTKGSGGISGDLELGVRGQVDYAQLISLTPWKALSYHSLEVGAVEIEARFGNVEFAGALSIFDQDEVYGTGFKGGLAASMNMGGKKKGFAAMGQFGTAPGGYDYFFVDLRTQFSPGFALGSLEIVGMGGGLYVNMSKQASVEAPAYGERNPPVNSTPGESFSGSTYTPDDGSIGFAVACSVQQAGKPEVFTGDMELTIEFGDDAGVRKILFDGDGYFFAKDRNKRKEAALQANLAMELNFERGFLSAQFAYELRAPYNNPILVGGDLNGDPQGALMIDINPDDDNEYANYFFFGKPRQPANVDLKIGDLRIGVDAYVMIGSDLPDPIPLREIHPALASFPDVSRSQGNGIGFAFGVQLATKGDATAGPLSLRWDLVAGVDASIRKYNGVTCANTGDEIGFNGWYVKGRAYAYISSGVKMRVRLNLGIKKINKTVTLADLAVAASLVAELPNPTYIGGKIRVTGSALGFSVSKNVSIEVGEKCEQQGEADASAIVADVNIIDAVYPEEESGDAGEFPVYDDFAVAFAYSLSYSSNRPATDESAISAEDDDGVESTYFPYLKSITLKDASGQEIPLTSSWNDDNTIVRLSYDEILTANANYTLEVRVRWRYRVDRGPFEDLRNNQGEYADEVRTIAITTGDFPTTMNLKMLEADRHFPGNGQRNWHQNFAPAEIYFTKSGMDEMFATPYPKEIAGVDEVREIDCRYAVVLTQLESGEKTELPITERPGSVTLEELRAEPISYTVPTGADGGSVTINYTRNRLTSYNSRAVKYTGFNDLDLEKGKMYRFEIVRIPIRPAGEEGIVAEAQEIAEQTEEAGIAIQRTSTTLSSNADPFYLPDVIYSFEFRVSKYNSLQEKVEQMRLVQSTVGPAIQGAEHPDVKAISRQDFLSYNLISGMQPVADKYYVYRIDEGFDWWERQRLGVNLRVEESAEPRYYDTAKGRALRSAVEVGQQFGRIPPAWQAAIRTDLSQDRNGMWAGVSFPEPARPGEMSPRLSQQEIEAGKTQDLVVEGTEAEDGNFTGSGKWDLAIVHRGKRALAYQAACLEYMGRMFDANYPHYNSGYAGQYLSDVIRNAIGDRYRSHRIPSVNGISPYEMSTLSFRTSGGTYGNTTKDHLLTQARGSTWSGDAPVLAGSGTLNISVTFNVYQSYNETTNLLLTNYHYSHFRYVWSRRFGYSLPSRSLIDTLRNAARQHGVTLGPVTPYNVPVKFYYQDSYESLTQPVEGGQSVSKTLENVMQ